MTQNCYIGWMLIYYAVKLLMHSCLIYISERNVEDMNYAYIKMHGVKAPLNFCHLCFAFFIFAAVLDVINILQCITAPTMVFSTYIQQLANS